MSDTKDYHKKYYQENKESITAMVKAAKLRYIAEGRFQCPLCNYRATSRQNLEYHQFKSRAHKPKAPPAEPSPATPADSL